METFFNKIFSWKSLYTFFILLIFTIGFWLRLDLYLYNFDLHVDEASLALNSIDLRYSKLFKPLGDFQTAPPMFLVISKFLYGLVKINYTVDFSTLVLRFFPFLCSVCTIPMFSYLSNAILKNRFLTVIGTFFIAINPGLISYSAIYKQYSLEALVAILVIILTLKIDLKNGNNYINLFFFILIALAPFFSYSSCFIFPGVFIYLVLKNIKQERKNFLFVGLAFIMIVYALYSYYYLYNIYFVNYAYKKTFFLNNGHAANLYSALVLFVEQAFRVYNNWGKNILTLILILSSSVLIYKNKLLSVLIITPFIICTIFTVFYHCGIVERLILFLVPFSIIIYLYLFKIIKLKIFIKYRKLLYTIAFIIISACSLTAPNKNCILKKCEYSKHVWNYFRENYKEGDVIIILPSSHSISYYAKFSNIETTPIYLNPKTRQYKKGKSWKIGDMRLINQIPDGIIHILATRYDLKSKAALKGVLLKEYKIIDYKLYRAAQTDNRELKDGVYMKLQRRLKP